MNQENPANATKIFFIEPFAQNLKAIIQCLKGLEGRDDPSLSFKRKAFEKGLQQVSALPQSTLQQHLQENTLDTLPQIGNATKKLLKEFWEHQSCTYLEELKNSLPEAYLTILQLPGIGPKKALQLCENLEIKGIYELEEACHSKKVQELAGFSEITEHKILQSIKSYQENYHKKKFFMVMPWSEEALALLSAMHPELTFAITGTLRRKMEVLDSIDYLVCGSSHLKSTLEASLETIEHQLQRPRPLPIQWHFSEPATWGWDLLQTTGPKEYTAKAFADKNSYQNLSDEPALFTQSDQVFIEPVHRDGVLLRATLPHNPLDILMLSKFQGVFHVHTTYSDGANSLEEMIQGALHLGYQYIGISDHSQSATYAKGLNTQRCFEQKQAIEQLQPRYPGIKILFGVESDILKDGSLDYPLTVLPLFDFIIASVHTRFGQNTLEMTQRISKAITNPFTTFLGHASGRILLERPPYAVDMEQIIKLSSEHGVAIELNASPYRLDFDWRYAPYFERYDTKTCLNPDAHSVQGYHAMESGILMAQKSLLPSDQFVNTKPLSWIQNWLKERKHNALSHL